MRSRACTWLFSSMQSTVSRIWRALALQPHRTESFQFSADPFFVEKVRDISSGCI